MIPKEAIWELLIYISGRCQSEFSIPKGGKIIFAFFSFKLLFLYYKIMAMNIWQQNVSKI